eukprot:7186059-Prymnesium_polylepis.1
MYVRTNLRRDRLPRGHRSLRSVWRGAGPCALGRWCRPLDASVCVECANNELTTHRTNTGRESRKSARVHKSRPHTRESAS